jgi:hypothetical protein
MVSRCRSYDPGLIILNHRLDLHGAENVVTADLWGKETYIDVFTRNEVTAPHHRAGALSRGLPPGMNRHYEDCGVCLSSCLDYWDDELVLQAFNRNLVLSPEIYGNPWFLRDDEFPRLARIFNIHRKYRKILVHAIRLPGSYGPYAVSRGDDTHRFITLRNLTWNDTTHLLVPGEELGLGICPEVEVRQLHPVERIIGYYRPGDRVEIRVPAFRSCLVYAGVPMDDEPCITGTEFNVIRNVKGKPLVIDLLGMPGTSCTIRLLDHDRYTKASIGKNTSTALISGKKMKVHFPGTELRYSCHRKVAGLSEIRIPRDVDALYESTVFSADNNALEVRALYRSGWSAEPQVRAAQEAFFSQDAFLRKGIWDRNLFDGNMYTAFWQKRRNNVAQGINGGCLRLDLGEVSSPDELIMRVPDYFSLQPLKRGVGYHVYTSRDLITWQAHPYVADTLIRVKMDKAVRYIKFNDFPQNIAEIEVYNNNVPLSRDLWRASNLFAPVSSMIAQKVWSASFTLDEIPAGSYLAIAINGEHGIEGAYASVKIGGKNKGCPDRAVSYPSNTWEHVVARSDRNYTYYFPLKGEMVHEEIQVFVMGYNRDKLDLKPEVWLCTYPPPYEKIRLVLE